MEVATNSEDSHGTRGGIAPPFFYLLGITDNGIKNSASPAATRVRAYPNTG